MQNVRIVGTSPTVGEVPIAVNDDGEVKIAEITANIDPTELATYAGQTAGNASLTSIDGKLPSPIGGKIPVTGTFTGTLVDPVDIGSPVRITGNAASQSIAVPPTTKYLLCEAEGGEVRLEIDGTATAASTLRIPEDGYVVYPIVGGTQTLTCYAIVGAFANVRFLA